ncbi:MAG: SDR family oxidoreductase [Candidatus Marinimicrobia bacterium]|nr:SDR family oxidoreductase [Candidatus Neomarinimicrobiota bacterium]
MEKILVTGGAGYKGTILIPKLLEKGYKVTLFDRFMWGYRPILHFASNNNLRIIKGDIRDKSLITEEVKNHDIILHLAAIVGYPACSADPNQAETTNIDGTKNICSVISDNQMLIFASTGSTYGKVEGICTEETPINPLSLYGSTKWEAEKMILDKKGVALRFATVFGISPRLRLDLLVNDFVYQAIHIKQIVLFEGYNRRTFLHVKDAVNSYLFAIDNYYKMRGKAFNIGDENMNYTKKDIALAIKEKIDYYLHEADIGEDLDKRDYEVSYEKIRMLGYKSKVSLSEGVDELVKVLRHLQIVNEWRNV